jgi:hypothetical protein
MNCALKDITKFSLGLTLAQIILTIEFLLLILVHLK